jgi:hypothetical protein
MRVNLYDSERRERDVRRVAEDASMNRVKPTMMPPPAAVVPRAV